MIRTVNLHPATTDQMTVVILLEITHFAHDGRKTTKAVQFGLIVTLWKFDVLKMTSI